MGHATFCGTTIATNPCIITFSRGTIQPTTAVVPLVGGGAVVQKQSSSKCPEHELQVEQFGVMSTFESFCATIESLVGSTGPLYVSTVDTVFSNCTLSRISTATALTVKTSIGGAAKYRTTITLTFVQDRT